MSAPFPLRAGQLRTERPLNQTRARSEGEPLDGTYPRLAQSVYTDKQISPPPGARVAGKTRNEGLECLSKPGAGPIAELPGMESVTTFSGGVEVANTSTRRFSRVLLALPFILGGMEAVRDPGPRVEEVKATGVPIPEAAVRVNGI